MCCKPNSDRSRDLGCGLDRSSCRGRIGGNSSSRSSSTRRCSPGGCSGGSGGNAEVAVVEP